MSDSDFKLDWNGDNSKFLINYIIPNLKLSIYDKQVMLWAYGCPPSDKNYEMESDGETVVCDMFLGGVIKSPAGVVHDYINRVKNHTTPDGKLWKPWGTNALYYRIMTALGYSFRLRIRRWIGVSFTSNFWWS